MAQPIDIQIERSLTNTPISLLYGEPAWDDTNEHLYVGNSSGVPILINPTPINSLEITLGNLQLVNDVASPGNSFFYGTDGGGVKGWFAQSSIDHDTLTNYIVDEHVAHTGVVLTAGTGLTGGGDISLSRTFNVVGVNSIVANADDIQLVNDVDAPGNLYFYGTNGTGTKNWLLQSSINHDSLTNFVADEHVAHSSVILTAGNGLSGGGDITTSRTFDINVQNSIEIVSDTLQLVNDAPAPGNLYFYSTDETGIKGWYEATSIFQNDFIFRETYFGDNDFFNVSGTGGDWVVTRAATAETDSISPSIPVRAFDDTQSQGVGFFISVPSEGQNVVLRFTHRAKSAPATPAGVQLVLYTRTLPDNAVMPSWVGPVTVTTFTLPTNTFWQYNSVSFPLTTLGITTARFVQFELVRDTASANDTLAGDWVLAQTTLLIT